MKSSDVQGRVLFISIVLVVLLGFLFVFLSFKYLNERSYDQSDLALQRTQQMLQLRLDGFFHEVEEDLREEAAAAAAPDSQLVADRWLPLLHSHWPITAIKLADERGNETALLRSDSTYLLMRTINGSKDTLPTMMRLSGKRGSPWIGPWYREQDYDPRQRVWFGKALEDARNEPSWTVRMSEDGQTPLLQVSYLIRGDTIGEPLRVISFTVDISRSSWIDTHSASLLRAGIVLLDNEGRSLGQLTASTNNALVSAADTAVISWQQHKSGKAFKVKANGKMYDCVVVAYPLNGQQLFTGLVSDLQPLDLWLMPEHLGLFVILTLLSVLSLLLIWAWLRKRKADENIRMQKQRNRSQELKLAKAIGEREVLNREVHHRVKNNLQVVSSLLNLQAMRLDDGVVKNEFLRGKRRIDTIALVHHKLYGLTDLRNVDLFRFFNDLIASLAEMHVPQSRGVSTEVETNGTHADQDTAIELGIILCELVANTFQHAFPYATGGHVEIRVVQVEGALYRLTVQDNGKGLSEDGPQETGKLGLEIVEALAEQLDGSFHVRTDGGVLFEVLFRMQHELTKDVVAEEDHGPTES